LWGGSAELPRLTPTKDYQPKQKNYATIAYGVWFMTDRKLYFQF
jgi:hypothetical protein